MCAKSAERLRQKKMTDNKIIHNLIEEELKEANQIHPLFQSPHEAYAVMLEELEETKEELVACESLLMDMWHRIRNDWGTEDLLKKMQAHAMYMVQESIQFGAMCQKALDSLYKEG